MGISVFNKEEYILAMFIYQAYIIYIIMKYTTIRLSQFNKIFLRNIMSFPSYIKSDDERLEFMKEYLQNGGVIKKQ